MALCSVSDVEQFLQVDLNTTVEAQSQILSYHMLMPLLSVMLVMM